MSPFLSFQDETKAKNRTTKEDLLIEHMSFCLEVHVYKLCHISILWVQSSTFKQHWNVLILTTWAYFLLLSYLFILNMKKTPSDIWGEPWQVYRRKIWHHFMFIYFLFPFVYLIFIFFEAWINCVLWTLGFLPDGLFN